LRKGPDCKQKECHKNENLQMAHEICHWLEIQPSHENLLKTYFVPGTAFCLSPGLIG
jgi:hypothetical protein